MANTHKTTSTRVPGAEHEPKAPGQPDQAPDDQTLELQRLESALADVRTECLTIEAKRHELDAERALVRARIDAAERRVETLRLELARSPEQVARAKAALLTAPDAGSERAASRDLTTLQEQIASFQRELEGLETDDSDARRLGELHEVERVLVEQLTEADRALGLQTFLRAERDLLGRELEIVAARRALDEAQEAHRTAFDRAIEQLIPWQERRDALRARFQPEGVRLGPWHRIARALLAYYDLVDQEAPHLPQLLKGRNILEVFSVPLHELNLVWSSPVGRWYTLPSAKRKVLEEVAKHGEHAIFWW